jgi:hypothetical protein
MPDSNRTKGQGDVPTDVFDKFVQALVDASTPPDVVNQLRKTLLQDKTFTERALKDAIFGEEVQL